jgi:hypothetical protein
MRARDPGPSRETTWHALPLDEPAARTNGHLCTFCVNFFFGGLGGAQRHFFDETKLWVPTSTTLAIHNGGNEMKWLRWPVAGLRCVPSARLRCARELWAVAGRPPGSDLFASKMGGGPSPTPEERVSRTQRSTWPGVAGRPLAHGVCSSHGGGGASDSRSLTEDFGQNVRSKTSRPSRQSAICGRRMTESVLRACHVH